MPPSSHPQPLTYPCIIHRTLKLFVIVLIATPSTHSHSQQRSDVAQVAVVRVYAEMCHRYLQSGMSSTRARSMCLNAVFTSSSRSKHDAITKTRGRRLEEPWGHKQRTESVHHGRHLILSCSTHQGNQCDQRWNLWIWHRIEKASERMKNRRGPCDI